MRPKDFWRLTPTELWWMFDAKQPPKMYGDMTEAEVAAIYEETYGSPDED
jgi:hypothetical protein